MPTKKKVKKPFKPFVVTDVDGYTLKVTKYRLTELTTRTQFRENPQPKFFIKLPELRKTGYARLHSVTAPMDMGYICISAYSGSIGCHRLWVEDFTRILKVAGFSLADIAHRIKNPKNMNASYVADFSSRYAAKKD